MLTHTGTIAGTPMYLSPEALKGPDAIDGRSDIYSLGAVGYFLLTGQPVFTGATIAEVCSAHLYSNPKRPSEQIETSLSPDLETLILRCLAKGPCGPPTGRWPPAGSPASLHGCGEIGPTRTPVFGGSGTGPSFASIARIRSNLDPNRLWTSIGHGVPALSRAGLLRDQQSVYCTRLPGPFYRMSPPFS